MQQVAINYYIPVYLAFQNHAVSFSLETTESVFIIYLNYLYSRDRGKVVAIQEQPSGSTDRKVIVFDVCSMIICNYKYHVQWHLPAEG